MLPVQLSLNYIRFVYAELLGSSSWQLVYISQQLAAFAAAHCRLRNSGAATTLAAAVSSRQSLKHTRCCFTSMTSYTLVFKQLPDCVISDSVLVSLRFYTYTCLPQRSGPCYELATV
eukprot:12287-Heterococcus_DN1.PRE.7